jgi:hypothetical protein
MDWAKARRGATLGMHRVGLTNTTKSQRSMHQAIYCLHVAELWVLPKYRFDSTVATEEHQTAPDLIVEWERQS